jgi:hypothetical protein
MSEKATKRPTALTPEIDCDQTARALSPLVTSAIFLIAKLKKKGKIDVKQRSSIAPRLVRSACDCGS